MSPSRVLVCDDELLIRLWLEEKPTDAGYAVVCAEDGGSALRLQQAEPADLVLLDLRLPDISGQQVLERLKAEEPDLPIIMMTAYGDVDTAVAAVRAGAHHFLEKRAG
jgi:DNA-binding NtrC family response regulator